MRRLAHELRLVLLALQFFTRVPVTGRLAAWVGWQPGWLNDSARYFPLIGLGIGAFGALVLTIAAQWWPVPVAVGLSIAATLLLTGAFHEDGLADSFDGLGGSADRERVLAIMKDSRIGSYGSAALIVVLGLKALALASLPIGWSAAALVVAHGLSRAVAVALIRALPYAGDAEHAKAKPLAQRVSTAGLVLACIWPLAAIAAFAAAQAASGSFAVPGWRAWIAALLAAAGAGLVCARWFRRRLGGVTGDMLGAAQQLSELAVLLAVLACVGR
ncbi:MAG TPA: adenosylcobinamide-GDP ribazoletransferase [Methylibium sp.]|uniref:adenosylcobinamide-GDP ribazoletransferase n=1 Tax=Methylibium sp. TaxID=2067992 RepID=UPI002DB8C32B|nr:adenosylcobinamide-GDP ribazoletransferase [Methylibium sp.]HEU4459900.1 adenosylcobinamide-GDP ribazoletransferase [Methylibium sp.]